MVKAVTFTGITIIPMILEDASNLPPEFAHFTPSFLGVALMDLLTIAGFTFRGLAISRIRQPVDQTFWIITRVLWVWMLTISRLTWLLTKQL